MQKYGIEGNVFEENVIWRVFGYFKTTNYDKLSKFVPPLWNFYKNHCNIITTFLA